MAGTCVDIAFTSLGDFTQTVYFIIPSSGRLQVQLNGVISEITASGPSSLSFIAGTNLLRLIASSGDIVMNGKLWGSDARTQWLSLYPDGQDPFTLGTPSGPSGGGGTSTITPSNN